MGPGVCLILLLLLLRGGDMMMQLARKTLWPKEREREAHTLCTWLFI